MNLICDTNVTWVIVFSHSDYGRSGMLTSGVFFFFLSDNVCREFHFLGYHASLQWAHSPVLSSFRMLFPALWYVLGPVYQDSKSSEGYWTMSLSPEISAFLSIISFLTVDSWLILTLLLLLVTLGMVADQVIPATHFSLWSPYLDLGSHAGNGPITRQITIQFSLCTMNTAWVWKRFRGENPSGLRATAGD